MKKHIILFLVMLVSAVCVPVNSLQAQLEVRSYSIDAGGGVLTGGSFSVDSSIGQPDAGNESSGGTFTVTGGDQSDDPPVLLGDVNGDGIVNLLDVTPFVDAIAGGDFIAEADVNQDGVVNLLDVEPFVAILSGG